MLQNQNSPNSDINILALSLKILTPAVKIFIEKDASFVPFSDRVQVNVKEIVACTSASVFRETALIKTNKNNLPDAACVNSTERILQSEGNSKDYVEQLGTLDGSLTTDCCEGLQYQHVQHKLKY